MKTNRTIKKITNSTKEQRYAAKKIIEWTLEDTIKKEAIYLLKTGVSVEEVLEILKNVFHKIFDQLE